MESHTDAATDKLVPEDGVDIQDEETTPGQNVPANLIAASKRLNEAGYTTRFKTTGGSTWIEFDLPSGRSTRTVLIHGETADELVDFDFADWKSLERHDGIWNPTKGAIEVLVRGDRFGAPPSLILRRIAEITSQTRDQRLPIDATDRNEEKAGLRLESNTGGVLIEIGESSVFAAALSDSAIRLPSPRRKSISMRISNVPISTTAGADSVVELISDSLFFDLYMTHRMKLSVRRLQRGGPVRLGRKTSPKEVAFPSNSYPHAPVTLFNTGIAAANSPLIRYWAFYQVLEFYFPKYHKAEAIHRLARFLKSPNFDPHRNEDVIEAANLAASTTGFSSEEEQLVATLRAILTPRELRTIVDALGNEEDLKKKSELTNCTVRVSDDAECITALSKRIYDIRCRIVHSKNNSNRDSSPGLIPGTHHDDLVIYELALMEEIAHRAIVASGERLHLPT
ncbi:hypothetical protein G6009_02140 [Dietzia sp. SLG510A3-30A2]|nr:hypothetical protein [Dietzia sp. SLG510A3-30A2]